MERGNCYNGKYLEWLISQNQKMEERYNEIFKESEEEKQEKMIIDLTKSTSGYEYVNDLSDSEGESWDEGSIQEDDQD